MLGTGKMAEPNHAAILPNFKKAFEGDGFKSDVRLFLSVAEDQFQTLIARLKMVKGVLGAFRLQLEIANSGIAVATHQQLLVRLIPIFARWGQTSLKGKKESFTATLIASLHSDFTESELGTLVTRFTALLEGEFPGLELADKSEAVARATGRVLRNAQLITDVRPVFDDAREQVLTVVPMTTLRLTTESLEDGVPASTWEVQLSEEELGEIGRKVAEAQQKLAVMKRLLLDKGLEIADCGMVTQDGDRS
jgi:hypothetical protein